MICYYIFRYLGVAQLVARLTGGQEAGSSSLLTQTNKADNSFELPALFFLQIVGYGLDRTAK